MSRSGQHGAADVHDGHEHRHGPACGHTVIWHGDHKDYLHDGCMHHVQGGQVFEHHIEVTPENPAECTEGHGCGEHGSEHRHSPGCGHETVPHGDHFDYLVAGHLHHPHGDHCDDHGPVRTEPNR